MKTRESAYLQLSIGPSWDLNDHVQDSLLLIGIEGDVMERRDRNAILLKVDSVLQSIRGTDLSDLVLGGMRSHVVVGMIVLM